MDKSNKFYGWRVAFVGFILMSTVYTIAINCSSLFVKPISDSLSVTRSQVSLIPTIMTLSFAVLSAFVGKIIAKFGIKKVMMFGALLVGLSFIGFSFSNSMTVLYIFSVVIGFGMAFCSTIPINILINNWFVEKKGMIMGIVFAGSGVGGFVFTQVVSYILKTSSWHRAYLILGIASLVLTLPLILFLVTRAPEDVGQKAYGADAHKEAQGGVQGSGFMLSEVKGSAAFIQIAMACFIINLVTLGVTGHVPSYISDLGYSTDFVASVNSIYLLAIIFAKIILGSIFDKFGGKRGFLIGGASFILGLIAMIFAANKVFALSFGVLFALAGSMGTVAIAFVVGDLFGKKDYGSILGLLTLIATVGASIGNPISGLIYDKFGSYNNAWILYIVMIVVMCMLVIGSYKSVKKLKAQEDK